MSRSAEGSQQISEAWPSMGWRSRTGLGLLLLTVTLGTQPATLLHLDSVYLFMMSFVLMYDGMALDAELRPLSPPHSLGPKPSLAQGAWEKIQGVCVGRGWQDPRWQERQLLTLCAGAKCPPPTFLGRGGRSTLVAFCPSTSLACADCSLSTQPTSRAAGWGPVCPICCCGVALPRPRAGPRGCSCTVNVESMRGFHD